MMTVLTDNITIMENVKLVNYNVKPVTMPTLVILVPPPIFITIIVILNVQLDIMPMETFV